MSPAERRYWMVAQRRAAAAQPEIHRALLRAFQILRESMTDAELERFIDSGQLDRLLTEVFDQATMDRAFLPVRDAIRRTVHDGFRYAVPDLPKGGRIHGALALMFDHLSPTVITAIRTLESKVITALSADIREAVRLAVQAGLESGNPRAAAKAIRPILGMSPTQVENAIKREAALRESGLAEAKIAKQMEAYRRRAIALNANTNARTAAGDAYKRGQMLAWQDAIDKGIVDGNRLKKQWIGVMDTRERPEHVAMEKEIQPYNALYSNGQMVPGDSEYNCRCISRFFVVAA